MGERFMMTLLSLIFLIAGQNSAAQSQTPTKISDAFAHAELPALTAFAHEDFTAPYKTDLTWTALDSADARAVTPQEKAISTRMRDLYEDVSFEHSERTYGPIGTKASHTALSRINTCIRAEQEALRERSGDLPKACHDDVIHDFTQEELAALKKESEAARQTTTLTANPPAQQSRPGTPSTSTAAPASRKDIPTIAKAANGAVVTIIMAVNDKPISQGTGFVVRPDGLIVTNYHVIETGDSAVVKLPDGAVFPVDSVLAMDKTRDLAIIKTHGKIFRTLTLGNSDQLQVGEEVVAIGNPLSLESTVSNGIVSGIRTAEKLGGKFLQITTPISPGSSGGPLFNMTGEVVGITTMYLEGGENLNFAIPVNDAKRLLLNQSATLSDLPNEPGKAPQSETEPSVKTGPVTPVQRDVLWMNHFLSEHSEPGDTYAIKNIDAHLQTIFAKVTKDDLSGKEDCVVSIHQERKGIEDVALLSFADLDPAEIKVFGGKDPARPDVVSVVSPMLQFVTLHNAPQIVLSGYANGRFIEPYNISPNSNVFFDSREAAEGFARVFKDAVALCREPR